MLGFALGLSLPCWAGYQAAGLALNDFKPSGPRRLLQLAAGIGLGFGFTSCLYYLWLCWFGAADLRYVALESTLLGAIALGCRRLRLSDDSPQAPTEAHFESWRRLAVACSILAVGAAAALALGYLDSPFGYGDSWNIWNHRARSIYRLGDEWRLAFSLNASHPDYPLLLPCTNARLWTYAGSELEWAPMLVAAIYFAALAAVVGGGLALVKSRVSGWLAVAALLGNVALLQSGISQFAEMPLLFYFTAAVVFIALHDSLPQRESKSDRPRLLLLAGSLAGLAAWTKNEGLMFVTALVAARCTISMLRLRRRTFMREATPFVLGAAVGLLVVAAFKISMPLDNDLVGGQSREATLRRLVDAERYRTIFVEGFAAVMKVLKGFAFVLPVAAFFLGRARTLPGDRGGLPTTLALLLYMTVGYGLVYLTTPHDLVWHLRTSADRLFMQLLPVGLWALFQFCGAPEELVAAEAADPTKTQPAAM